jgi:cephalosporin-C deacetylase-like acetyl esterase
MRALDYLLSRPEVDPERVGCTGNSGGGTLTAYLAALDDRIKVAAPSCYITSWRSLLEELGPQDAEQVLLPFLRDGLDHGDLVEAFAPKPYLILSAIRDFFPIEGARETFREAKRIYALQGAAERLDMVEADDQHGYTLPRRLAVYRWMKRWLKGEDTPTEETSFQLESYSDLQCTDSGQVGLSFPGETIHSMNLQALSNLPSRPAMVASESDRAEFKRTVQDRVRKLAGIELASRPSGLRGLGQVRREGYRIEKLLWESEPGIMVPALIFVPDRVTGKLPALLYVHGGGKQAEADPGGEIEQWVKGGYLVLAVDPRGLGETDTDRSDGWFSYYFGRYDAGMSSFLIGKTLVGQRTRDVIQALDLLLAWPEVDGNEILGFGTGIGAVVLLHAAVVDDRLKSLILEDMLVSYESVMTHKIHREVFENFVPGVLGNYDLPELAASLAPRTLWLVNAADPLGHVLLPSQVREMYTTAREAFRAGGSPEGFQVRERNLGEDVRQFYGEWLKKAR